MDQEQTWIKQVRQAQHGDDSSMSWLIHEAQGRLCAYIYRVTLDHDLTEDLTQEALLQMVKSLEHLKEEESFWPWLYRIAQSKIQEHFKSKRKEKLVSDAAFYKDFLSYHEDYYEDEGLRELLQEDLLKKVMVAMKQLKQQYRAILSLRCFDQLSYADIAQTMGSNEVTVRVLFYRARKALRRQLTSQGLSSGMMLMGLGLFGRLTAPVKAATPTAAVSAASTEVGITTAVLATISSKTGIAILSIVAILLVAIFGMNIFPETPLPTPSLPESSLPARNEINSFHFTVQLMDSDPNAEGSLSKGAYERWFYFPEGVDGPMFMRMQRWDPNGVEKLCAWLENEQGNYYYESGEKIVYIGNSRVCWSNLHVRRLPTDSEEFLSFLSEVEGEFSAVREYQWDTKTGLAISSMDYRFINASRFRTDYEYNTIEPNLFEYKWDEPVLSVQDHRDQMHKRGWTYFRIDGEVNKKDVTGWGRIPFVYSTCKEYPAWLKINIGDELEIIDCSDGAQLCQADGDVIATYPAGEFFKGLPRPWMGMHTADVVRRDAVEQRVWFYSERLENEEEVAVGMLYKHFASNVELTYIIDMENDIVKEIWFDIDGRDKGRLKFTYLQDIEQAGDEFAEPIVLKNEKAASQELHGILWLFNLAQGNLDK